MDDRLLFHREDLGDGFLSDMDDEVDMEEIREGMKLVPLPDMYPDIDREAPFSSLDDILRLQGADDPYKSNEEDQSHSGEAAKKAAKVAAPHVLTGGVVAESGPPPDFSLWTVEDDLLLRNAMEAGAAMEALARGAMRFSRRYTVRELRERWRALLYDPEISSKAAIRMVEAEASFLESMRLMFPNKQKLQDFVHKRRQKSVRDTFYKRKRGLADDKGVLDGVADGGSQINLGENDLDMLVDPDDHAFSQMVDLLATGGIGAVIGAFPGESELETQQDAKDEVSLESSLSPVMVAAPEKSSQTKLDEPNGAAENDVTGDAKKELHATISGERMPSSSNLDVNGNPEPYVILSSDEEEDDYFRKPKKSRTDSVVQEKFVCSFNTQETEISAFGAMSSPSSERVPSSPEDGRGCTSDMRSSDCLDRADDETAETSEKPIIEGGSYTSFASANVKIEPGTETTGGLEVDYSAPKAGTCTDNELEVTTGVQELPPEVESDNEIARFSDVETMILDMDLDPGDNELSARAESKRFYGQHQMTILRLEQSVNAVMQRYLTRKGAIAMLYGYHLKYLMVANEVSIGRRTQGNVVDVDLAQEGPANRVSRKQASIKLNEDGMFHLKNLGKKVLYVNDVLVFTGQRAILSSSCLIEVGGMRLVFEMNRRLTHQRVKEMTQESS
ncbi:uncharacterized protein LOC112341773 isoform X1 [Selaginella moellendorffii]|uniref:uncharacterized protein LOC112341773 isoform X1 n=2 Tax=Selaginella moellendorffii TaxID=88036 RepID=UPI000D1C56E1|nr:uncharacterized protein LOC112341773 isoform X1 [Selaginella moellendorffii]|eukprot:XP_024518218.1 uncharacterized protein LOC112341773 isoform X1 [Selaginella moellendorffii]